MALRIALVAFAASLGLDLAEFERAASCLKSSEAWLEARLAELSWPSIGLEESPSISPDTPIETRVVAKPELQAISARDDLAFETAVEGMASLFATDLVAMQPQSRAQASPELVVAYQTEPDPTPDPVEVPIAADSRLEQISNAVRLTRQAVGAWASLMQPTNPQPDDPLADAF